MKIRSLSWSIALAFAGSVVALAPHKNASAENVECGLGDCEAPAPYTLKIISLGEGAPQASNDTPEGLQQNRRVDVGISTQVPVTEKPSAKEVTAPVVVETTNVPQSGSGTFWVSRDPTSIRQVLGVKSPAIATLTEDNTLENPVKVSLGTNYGAFIDRWQLLILPAGSAIDSDPFFAAQGKLTGVVTEMEWDGTLSTGDRARPGDRFDIAIRVYDKNGNYDQTISRSIEFESQLQQSSVDTTLQALDDLSVKSLNEDPEYSEGFARQSIAVSGSTVVLRGTDLSDVQTVEVNGYEVRVASNEAFAVEYILPPGNHEFSITGSRKSGEVIERKLDVEVKPNYFFVVALADLTIGENSVSGSIEPLAADEDHFGGDIFVDGRLAFYLKGRVQGKYLITAQVDTGNEDISELFNDFNRDDTRSVFRRIDPDEFYLVYGDDSTIIDDTDSQGKLYLRVDWDSSHALWGNFNTAFSGSGFATFNRSLYGGQFRHRSTDSTNLGDRKTNISAFISEAQTASRHNEFLGTGGSLYYLRDQDIVLGSEKVAVEVRRENSEQVLQQIILERGRDYEIDEFQGRIILTRPLLSISADSGPSIIRDEPQPDENTFLVVDYEYIPEDFVSGDASAGVRAKRWINDHVAVGGTFAHENRDVDDYNVKGFDVTLKKSDNTYLRAEVAQSEANQTSGSFQSDDGGLTFSSFSSDVGSASGVAVGLEARVTVSDVLDTELPVSVAAWAKNRDADFSTSSLETGADITDTGIEVMAEVNGYLSLSGRATNFRRRSESSDSIVALQADYYYSDRTTVSGEVRHVNNENLDSDTSESATLAAGKVAVQVTDSLATYGIAQGALNRSSNYQSNNLYTLGATADLNERTSVSAEVSSGDRGTNFLVGVDHAFSGTYSVYGNVNLLRDRIHVSEQVVTLGQRKTVSDKLKVFTEHQFSSEDARAGYTNTFGLSNTFSRYVTGTLSFQAARIEDEIDDTIERDAVTAGLSFKRQQSHISTKLEFRKDRSNSVDTDQWVTITRIEHRHSPSLKIQGRFNHSSTEDNIANDDARFTEAGIGFAYRPVSNDRLNLLGRYTYLFDLPPFTQSGDTDKRSSIFSFESLYEVGKRWTVGGKLAYREGEIRVERGSGEWIDNDAALASARIRYKAWFGIEAMGAYHWLNSDATDSVRHGALTSLGHTVGNNFQFSVGYNFTSFDDNLGNDDFDVNGWFLNFAGKY